MNPPKKSAGIVVYRCAGPGCGRFKEAANKWWLLWGSRKGNVSVMSVCAWDEEIALNEAVLPVCGEGCAQKLISQFMANVLENQEHEPHVQHAG